MNLPDGRRRHRPAPVCLAAGPGTVMIGACRRAPPRRCPGHLAADNCPPAPAGDDDALGGEPGQGAPHRGDRQAVAARQLARRRICSPGASLPEPAASRIAPVICCQPGHRVPLRAASTGNAECLTNGLPVQVTSAHRRSRA
jgi:hypothetical protein